MSGQASIAQKPGVATCALARPLPRKCNTRPGLAFKAGAGVQPFVAYATKGCTGNTGRFPGLIGECAKRGLGL
jgi:hypothetical protein